MDVQDIVARELHQMNIYLKSIAESLANRKVILKAKPENRKKIEEQIANSPDGGVLFIDDTIGLTMWKKENNNE
jgi:hypothetical protein